VRTSDDCSRGKYTLMSIGHGQAELNGNFSFSSVPDRVNWTGIEIECKKKEREQAMSAPQDQGCAGLRMSTSIDSTPSEKSAD
jgi:hypothetical protein